MNDRIPFHSGLLSWLGTVDPARYAAANAFFLKAGLIPKAIKTEKSLDASVWK